MCNNADRAEWANKAIVNFRDTTGTEHEDALCDLLCDLRHWADEQGQDFFHELDRANGHYTDEIIEEKEFREHLRSEVSRKLPDFSWKEGEEL